jgi:uncharacterized protein YbaR (Trm112 family)
LQNGTNGLFLQELFFSLLTGVRVPNVIACPNCEKKLAVKEELKGRALICPQCKGRFTVPAGDSPSADPLDLAELSAPSTDDGGTGFFDSLGSSSPAPIKSVGASSLRASAARPASPKPTRAGVATGPSRATARRAKTQAEQMKMVYIGGGIAAAVLLLIIVVVVANSGGGSSGKTVEPEDIRFNLKEGVRIQLFKKLVSAVDEYGISPACKKEWYRIADEYNLDRSNIKDVLEEGFAFKNKKWELPEATSTAKNRAVRMEWVAQRRGGSDPILSQ